MVSLNLSGCSSLAFLLCNDNQIDSLGLSGLTALVYLDCSNNKLTELEAANCALAVLHSLHNPLRQIAAGMNGSLIEVASNGQGTVGLDYDEKIGKAVATPDSTFSFINWTDNNMGGVEISVADTIELAIGKSLDLTANFQQTATDLADTEIVKFLIYPNPASTVVNVQSTVFNQQPSVMEFYDLNGRKLIEKQIQQGSENAEIDVSHLKNGIYFCKLNAKNESIINKLIIRN
jgi:hypothetical protein